MHIDYIQKRSKEEKRIDYTQVIQFNLNNFSFKGNDKIIDIYGVKNDSDLTLSDKIIFVQIYVPNLRKKWYNEGIESLNEKFFRNIHFSFSRNGHRKTRGA